MRHLLRSHIISTDAPRFAPFDSLSFVERVKTRLGKPLPELDPSGGLAAPDTISSSSTRPSGLAAGLVERFLGELSAYLGGGSDPRRAASPAVADDRVRDVMGEPAVKQSIMAATDRTVRFDPFASYSDTHDTIRDRTAGQFADMFAKLDAGRGDELSGLSPDLADRVRRTMEQPAIQDNIRAAADNAYEHHNLVGRPYSEIFDAQRARVQASFIDLFTKMDAGHS